ncbi:hypothetical protein G6F56_010889 [Rhizopus delemar]|uniref:Uncharacterized protein n=1 Tax=Rhizopus stolonifer TaxID=4846 RepID=A0A367KHR8_RHIST|nr:hypothetical protein G6F56_010889 [Rhizopus delemar]RCI01775.1 hypothetical protein CU098_007794 [Rhizopus stolonifer]
MTDNRTIIKEIPNLLEQPILDYSPSKAIGGSSLGATRGVERHPMQALEISFTVVQTPEDRGANDNNF